MIFSFNKGCFYKLGFNRRRYVIMKTEQLHRHVCSITGKGMSKGFVLNDEYIENEADLIKTLN